MEVEKRYAQGHTEPASKSNTAVIGSFVSVIAETPLWTDVSRRSRWSSSNVPIPRHPSSGRRWPQQVFSSARGMKKPSFGVGSRKGAAAGSRRPSSGKVPAQTVSLLGLQERVKSQGGPRSGPGGLEGATSR